MNSKDLIEACDILLELEKEFSGEESRLEEISNERLFKIEEIEHQIITFRRNEDVDFRVFSPRNTSNVNSEKIRSLEEEKKALEREKNDADRQLNYYSGKAEKIGRVISILRSELGDDSNEDNLTVKKSRNPFAFLDEIEENEAVEVDEDFSNEDIDLDSDKVAEVDEVEMESGLDLLAKENEDASVDIGNVIAGVPVSEVDRVCHKVEFSQKILDNDRVRAKLELKEIVTELKELVRVYG